ncbi:MAG: hypothetical protein MZU84_08205 [Sphingobacterium sp.]|nr:hypothetical protein [Sphingobacterium sp.]
MEGIKMRRQLERAKWAADRSIPGVHGGRRLRSAGWDPASAHDKAGRDALVAAHMTQTAPAAVRVRLRRRTLIRLHRQVERHGG